jgi:hypothetical protein
VAVRRIMVTPCLAKIDPIASVQKSPVISLLRGQHCASGRVAVAVRNASECDAAAALGCQPTGSAALPSEALAGIHLGPLASYPGLVRWLVLVASMTAVMACTSLNPAYETTADGTGPDPSDGDPTGGTTSTTAGSTHAEVSGEASSESSAGESSSTGDVPLPDPDPLCRFDLVAVNEMGQLHVLDPDRGDSWRRLEDDRLISLAVATQPSTGILFVNQRDSPGTVLRVDPFVPEILPEPIVLEVEPPVEPLEEMARATFRGENELWLGTHETHRFMWVPPTGGAIAANEVFEPFSRGGDMVFLEGSCAVVPTLDGLFSACFPAPPGPVPPLMVVGLEVGSFPQFTGIAVDEQGRMWLSIADPNPGLLFIDRTRQPWTVGEQIPYDITMNDLSTVIHRDDC